jgi:flagellar biosynthesis protein FliR
MIPTEFAHVESTLSLWLVSMVRPGAAFIVAPLFSAAGVPLQLRLILALAIGIPAITRGTIAVDAQGLLSVAGFLLVLGEAIIGAMIGFAMQVGFAAASLAGEVIGNAMGLGFAAMIDPMNGQHSPIIGQFLTIFATFLFLAIDGHLVLAATLGASYDALPPGGAWLALIDGQRMALMGSMLFATALSIALPVAFAVILVQIVMGMLSRSAPALNIFAVGFPATVMAGILFLGIATPMMGNAVIGALNFGLDRADAIANGR